MNAFKALLLSLLALPAYAQTAITRIETVTAAERPKVQAIFTQQQRNLAESCETATIIKATNLSVLEEPTYSSQQQPITGLWTVRYSVNTCGTVALRNAEFKPVSGGIAIRALVPGETLADGKLQADILHSFALAAREMMPQCREEPNVRSTTVRVYPKTGKDRWQELWVAEVCKRDVAQTIEFLPTKGGTTFKMNVPTPQIKHQKI